MINNEQCLYLPTTRSSPSAAPGRSLCHISIVNIVLELLNTEVSELIRAAIIAASINPLRPETKPELYAYNIYRLTFAAFTAIIPHLS